MTWRSNGERSGESWSTSNRLTSAAALFPAEIQTHICEQLEKIAGLGHVPTFVEIASVFDEIASVFDVVRRTDLLILARIYKAYDRDRLLKLAEFGEAHPAFQLDRQDEHYVSLHEFALSDAIDDPELVSDVTQVFAALVDRELAAPKTAESVDQPDEPSKADEQRNGHAVESEPVIQRRLGRARRWMMPVVVAACLPLLLLFGTGWATEASRTAAVEAELGKALQDIRDIRKTTWQVNRILQTLGESDDPQETMLRIGEVVGVLSDGLEDVFERPWMVDEVGD